MDDDDGVCVFFSCRKNKNPCTFITTLFNHTELQDTMCGHVLSYKYPPCYKESTVAIKKGVIANKVFRLLLIRTSAVL